MATGSGVNQGKGKFLEEFLPDNRLTPRWWRSPGLGCGGA